MTGRPVKSRRGPVRDNRAAVAAILIRKWRKQYHERKIQPLLTTQPMKRNQNQTEKIKALEKQLKQTQKALQDEKVKNRAYEVMIEVAEQELNIPVRGTPCEKSMGRGPPGQTVNRLRKEFPFVSVEKLCQLFGLSRTVFYKAEKRVSERYLQEALVLEEVRKIKREQSKLGTEKVYLLIQPFLTEHSIKMGRDKLYDLLRTHHLLPKRKKEVLVLRILNTDSISTQT